MQYNQRKQKIAPLLVNPTEKKLITPTNNFPSFLFRQKANISKKQEDQGSLLS